MRVLDLFSGIGGMSLGLERAGMTTVAFCEIDPFCRAVLRKHWPRVPIHEDITRLSGEQYRGAVDLVCGGFPCQDLSVAGKGAGLTGDRSGLWFEMLRVVSEVRPRWVLAENVPALLSRGIDVVLEGLEKQGYTCWPFVVGADDVGAPHRRKRIWLIARRVADDERQPVRHGGSGSTSRATREVQIHGEERERVRADDSAGRAARGAVGLADRHGRGREAERVCGVRDREREGRRDDADGRGAWPVGSPTGSGLEGTGGDLRVPSGGGPAAGPSEARWPARPGEPQWEWEEPRLVAFSECGVGGRRPRDEELLGDGEEAGRDEGERGPIGHGEAQDTEPRTTQQPVGGATDGLSKRLVRLARRANRDALKAYGNAVVPAIVEHIGRAIMSTEGER